MKMSKVFAAGVAASLAVTSLASVASAIPVEREFDMKYSTGVWVYDAEITGEEAETLGDNFKFVTPAGLPDTYAVDGLAEVAVLANGDTNLDGTINYKDFDGFVPLRVSSANNAIPLGAMGNLTITVEGRKYDNGNLVQRTQKITLIKVSSVNLDGAGADATINYVLPIYVETAPNDAFLPEEFSAVDRITIKADGLKSIVINGLDKAEYTYLFNLVKNGTQPNLKVDPANAHDWYNVQNKGTANWWEGDGWQETNVYIAGAVDATLRIELAAADPLNTELLYQCAGTVRAADGGLALSGASIADDGILADGTGVKAGAALIKEINTLLDGGLTAKWKAQKSGLVVDNNAWLPVTADDDAIIYRWEVERLSDTDDYTSANLWGGDETADTNQTYNERGNDNDKYRHGTGPSGFAGLSSHVADFFNQQNNGKIKFYFTAKVDDNGNTFNWAEGGIPSTEVGLRNFFQNAKATDFALFFNYNATTGSLQADASLDPYSAAVEFDITPILTKLGGQTIGIVQDIYYALSNGASFNNGVLGLYVDKVVLSYEPAAKADVDSKQDDAKEEAKPDDKADEPVIDDDTEEDDDFIDDTDEPDDSTVIIDDDDDTASTEVDNTGDNTVVVNPGTSAPAADENPHTGVALAVVPAALAAAAMLISKKRK